MRILTAADIRRTVTMPAAIDAVASAFAQLSTGGAEVPLRTAIAQVAHDSHTFFMPALLGRSGGLGLKIVSVFPHNSTRYGMPSIHAMVLLVDAATGRPAALMDGTYLTALRTGAASGVATHLLARADSKVLALFGAGAQAPAQVEAVCAVRPIERILIVNRTPDRAHALIATLRERGIGADVLLVASPAAALSEADIVCCATSSPEPLFPDADVREGTHLNGVGSFTPRMIEIPPATIGRARVVVDQRAAALAESGELIAAQEAGLLDSARLAELGEVVAGIAPGRQDSREITFFKSVGNAAQDVAVAQLALAQAEKLGLGIAVDL